MKISRLLFLLCLFGCDEFYDEEFEEFQTEQSRVTQNTTYQAELISTDQNLQIKGNVTVAVVDEKVNVSLKVENIPQNIIQVHYAYLNVTCQDLMRTVTADTVTQRIVSFEEETSTEALSADLDSTGSATSEGDINLEGKSFVVKAFSNFPEIPDSTGTDQMNIACGELRISENISL